MLLMEFAVSTVTETQLIAIAAQGVGYNMALGIYFRVRRVLVCNINMIDSATSNERSVYKVGNIRLVSRQMFRFNCSTTVCLVAGQ